jgi:AraC-like DNA-binding protein
MDDKILALELALWIDQHLTADCGEPELERASGYSINRLREKFFAVTGETPSAYLRKRRLTEAAKDLLRGEAIVDVAIKYGYSSQENFTTTFKSWFGLNPGELRTMDKRYSDFLSRMKEPLSIMELTKLKQPPLCSTLMSCVKGASDYFDLGWNEAKLFGYGSMAFMVNMHQDLCPSGPYVWNMDQMFLRLRDMGIRRVERVSLTKESPAEAIKRAEDKLRAWLDSGKLAILEFLEYQLVLGYGEKGLTFLRSWNDDNCKTELKQLSFGNWAECLQSEGWVNFVLVEPEAEVADEPSLLRSSLSLALRIRSEPEAFQCPGYLVGDRAWSTWLDGLGRGLGTGHGHWWNAMVWAECRSMAGAFFNEVRPLLKGERQLELAKNLSEVYGDCGKELQTAGSRELAAEKQTAGITRCRELDARAEKLTRELVSLL